MQPLSARTRRAYVALLALLFFVSVPLALFYATGYRYEGGFGLVRTGGMYLSVPYDEATVFVDGEEVGRTGFLNKGFYVDDLAPASFEVRVERDGSLAWSRTLVVEPQVVTRGEVTLVPLEPTIVRLTRGGITSSTTRGVTPDVYDAYRAAFARYATSTGANEDIVASIEDGNVYVRWMDDAQKPPDNFCVAPSACVREIAVEEASETALSVALYDGGIVYATREGGVYFAELDVRPTPISVRLYPKAGAGVRVVGEDLVVRDGSTLYLVEGF